MGVNDTVAAASASATIVAGSGVVEAADVGVLLGGKGVGDNVGEVFAAPVGGKAVPPPCATSVAGTSVGVTGVLVADCVVEVTIRVGRCVGEGGTGVLLGGGTNVFVGRGVLLSISATAIGVAVVTCVGTYVFVGEVVGVLVNMMVDVAVNVAVGTGVSVAVGVGVNVAVAVAVGVNVGV